MSSAGSYPVRSFSEIQTFLVYDPSTSTTVRVKGSDLVNYITPSLNSVMTETTTDALVNEDYRVGSVVQTTGQSAPGDGSSGLFLVVQPGEGDIPMFNGNELLVLSGANTAAGISYNNTTSGIPSGNVQGALDAFTSSSAGRGSDLVAYAGIGVQRTLTDVLGQYGLVASNYAGADGGEKIQAALDAAELMAGQTVVIVPPVGPDADGKWVLNDRLMLPSNVTLVLWNCHIYLNDNVNTNIMRTKGADEVPLGSNQNIYVVGFGKAILEGNATNQPGLPNDNTGDVNRLGVVFFNTQNFAIKNITVRETHGWGISCENGCAFGDIGPIHFEQTGSTPNQDGVNLRQGCHDIEVHDISGTTGDDSVALTAIGFSGAVPGNDGMQITYDDVAGIDIYNVTVRNVKTRLKNTHHTLRLLNSDARKIYDIEIESINDITLPSDILTAAKAINAVITINGGTYFDVAEVQEDEMRNIEITDVSGNANSTIIFGNQCGRITVNGVTGRGYCKGLLRFDKTGAGSPLMKEISIRGLSFQPFVDSLDFDWADSGTVIYVGRAELANVDIEETYILLCTRVFQSTADATLLNCKIRKSRVTKTGFEPFLIDSVSFFSNCVLQDFEIGSRTDIGSGTGATLGRFYGPNFKFVLKGDCPDVTSVDTVPNAYKASRVIFAAGVGGFVDATYAMGDSVAWQPIVTLPNY